MKEDLEMYLMQVARQLRGVPPQQREAELREVESHLRAMIEAREIGGVLYSEALKESLHQFGSPSRVGRGLTQAWRKNQDEPASRAVAAALSAFVGQSILGGGALIISYNLHLYLLHRGYDTGRLSGQLNCLFLLMFYGLAPFLAGAFATSLAPRRGWWAALGGSFFSIAILWHVLEAWHILNDSFGITGAISFSLYGIVPALLCGVFVSKRRDRQQQVDRQFRASQSAAL